MTEALASDIRLLSQILDRVSPPETVRAAEELAHACEHHEPDRAARKIAALSDDAILAILRTETIRFHLRNKAEQIEVARINHRRERDATLQSPRAESIADAIHRLARAGRSDDDVLALLARLDIQSTLTAHPTEARRRSILRKQQAIADGLTRLHRPDTTPRQRRTAKEDLARTMRILLATDEVRAERLRVTEEVRNGLYFLTGSIWEAIPALYRDAADAIEANFGKRPRLRDLPTFIRYRSWIGGDRDGNPNVTPDVTRHTLQTLRASAIDLYIPALGGLVQELSLSERRVHAPDALRLAIQADADEKLVSTEELHHLRYEPFRVRLRQITGRLTQLRNAAPGEHPYDAATFVRDLELIDDCLRDVGLGDVAEGDLAYLLVRARTFGFHLAALDVRQHSKVHEEAVAELLRLAGVEPDYPSLDENTRLELLARELQNPRPLLPRGIELDEQTRRTLDVFDVLRDAGPDAVGSYVISMTHKVSDLLEVVLLAKEAGLWRYDGNHVHTPLDLVPLFETVEDLGCAADLSRAMIDHPVYRAHLRARSDFQEIMLGYSDSNKDGGYWAANWSLQKAQATLARVFHDAGIDARLFHGRGGTVGRGGGRANRAIRAAPPESQNGRIRFTEQGEVITFRYALPAIAHRHLEQIVHAMLLATPTPGEPPAEQSDQHAEAAGLMERIAEASMHAYRELINDPAFWPWYRAASPIDHIGGLPLASRPVGRTGDRLDFENLRAIPWVFAWTQMRYNVPGWYGVGAGLEAVTADDPEALDTLRDLYRSWEFFHAVVDNAQQEMARARLETARRYTARAGEQGEQFHKRIQAEFERARAAVLAITGQNELLDSNPVIQESIRRRNPRTDVLNLAQADLLRRHEETDDAGRERLRNHLFLSINGIAAAMQATG